MRGFRNPVVCDSKEQAVAEGASFFWGRLCKYGHGPGLSKRYVSGGCVECMRLYRLGKHPGFSKRKAYAARARMGNKKYGDDPGKHALDNYLRESDTGEVKEVWDE